MKILIAGDFCDRYRVSDKIAKEDYAFMFDDVKPIIEQADYSIVNFEFPVVVKEGKPIPKCGPNLKGQTKAVAAIKYAGFNVCTLANNHILDQGEECCLDTKRLIENAGMKTVGVGKNLSEAGNILYLKKDEETLAVINCCEHEFSIATDTTAGANPLNTIQQYYKIKEARQYADYVLVIVHGGHEHYQLPSPRMKEAYRFFVDAGADAVVNHHQHCYSGYEVYNGKPIFYGLGNFCFDDISERNGIWNEGFLLGLNLESRNRIVFEITPYKQCCETPSVRLLDTKDGFSFKTKLSELNRIIIDDALLEEMTNKYYDYCKEYEMSLLEPYSNIITSKLYRMGIFPKIFKGEKKSAILNHIYCESHQEKIIYALTK